MDPLMNDVKDQGGGMNELELRVLNLEHQVYNYYFYLYKLTRVSYIDKKYIY